MMVRFSSMARAIMVLRAPSPDESRSVTAVRISGLTPAEATGAVFRVCGSTRATRDKPETAARHRDPARFLEQLVPVARAHDERVDPGEHGVDAVQIGDPVLRLPAFRHVLGDAGEAHDAVRFVVDRETLSTRSSGWRLPAG